MKYLLDTDICIHLIRRKELKVLKRLKALKPGQVAISAVTLSELAYGAEKSADPARNFKALESFTLPLEVLPYDAAAAIHYGRVRAALEKKGKIIGGMDLLIAAHALSVSLPVVTNNTREFSRVPGLKVENWL